MLSPSDLQAYFDRIDWHGAPVADRATLAGIVAAHAAAIPFESLDPLLGRAPQLAPNALIDKLVHGGRGGYCFEQNGLLRLVLETLSFTVTGLAARVLWNQPEDALTHRSHMALLVDLDECPVLVDVGFGGAVLTGVLDLVADRAQATPHEPFRLLECNGEWRQQVRVGEAWRTTYRFDLQPQLAVDYEAPNWWCATHPSSHFTHMPMVSRALPDRRLALRGRDFAVHRLGGETERRRIESTEELCDILRNEFGIRLPDEARLIAKLEAMED